MSVQPVLPLALLLVLAAVVVGARAITLSAVLARPRDSRRRALLRWGAMTVAMLLLVVAAARPGLESPAQPRPDRDAAAVSQGADTNVFFVVDRSVDSRVADYGGQTRMSGIRADMASIIQTYPKARFAVIGFASDPAIEWPLSEDVWSLTAVIAGLSPYVSAPADAAAQVTAGAAAISIDAASPGLAAACWMAGPRVSIAGNPGACRLLIGSGMGAAGSAWAGITEPPPSTTSAVAVALVSVVRIDGMSPPG